VPCGLAPRAATRAPHDPGGIGSTGGHKGPPRPGGNRTGGHKGPYDPGGISSTGGHKAPTTRGEPDGRPQGPPPPAAPRPPLPYAMRRGPDGRGWTRRATTRVAPTIHVLCAYAQIPIIHLMIHILCEALIIHLYLSCAQWTPRARSTQTVYGRGDPRGRPTGSPPSSLHTTQRALALLASLRQTFPHNSSIFRLLSHINSALAVIL
jgi:hypothetical protein